MRIVYNSGAELYIPNSILDRVRDYDKWSGSTSFLQEFLKKNRPPAYSFFYGEFSFRYGCLSLLRDVIYGDYESYLDLLGGVGVTAKLFQTSIEDTFVNDIDDDCYEVLQHNFTNVHKDDMFAFPYRSAGYDLIFVDYNDHTLYKAIRNYRRVNNAVFGAANRYVILNDCSVYHTNFGKGYRVYSTVLEEQVTTREEMFFAAKRFYKRLYPEWSLVGIEHFYKSSYFLFERVDTESLHIHFNDRNSFAKKLLTIVED